MAQLIRDALPQSAFSEPLMALLKAIANVAWLESACGLAGLAGERD